VILFENPPYADAAGVESNVSGKKKAFGWQASWVKAQMAAEPAISRNGTKPLRDLTNLFIWSAFKYYLRQPTDSYVVFSPSKYFKSQGADQPEVHRRLPLQPQAVPRHEGCRRVLHPVGERA